MFVADVMPARVARVPVFEGRAPAAPTPDDHLAACRYFSRDAKHPAVGRLCDGAGAGRRAGVGGSARRPGGPSRQFGGPGAGGFRPRTWTPGSGSVRRVLAARAAVLVAVAAPGE